MTPQLVVLQAYTQSPYSFWSGEFTEVLYLRSWHIADSFSILGCYSWNLEL